MRTALLCLMLSLTGLPFIPGTAHVTVQGPPAGTWRIDPAHSVVQFRVTKLGYDDVIGQFGKYSGTVRYDSAQPSNGTVEWSVEVGSVKTDNHNRDRALQSPDYFDGTRHPRMTFQGQTVGAVDGGRLRVDGAITIKGRTRPLSIAVRPVERGFETEFELNRYDFGITGGTVLGRLIGRNVRVRLVAIAAEEES